MGLASRFNKSVAVVIGIDAYNNGVPPLDTAANDARRLASMLADLHEFDTRLYLDADATREKLISLLKDELPNELGEDDRLIFYFAGHGVALDGDDGPNGYLLPADARRGEEDTYLFMPLVHDALLDLPVRHALIIMDSCFSGAFRWAATRDVIGLPFVIHEERFDRFVKDPAWQVITSTAHDQKAMDNLASGSLGTRPGEDGHSPFAMALFEALEGKGDVVPQDGDGLITATELYLYLEDRLQPESIEAGLRQTPGLWPLRRHDKGEFVFATPGRDLNLPPAPELNLANNPYRGLEPFEKEHAELFFGRKEVIAELKERIEHHALTAVLGASGTGKSSVVKAGLLPKLDARDGWTILPIARPGAHPLVSLARAVGSAPTVISIKQKIESHCENNDKVILVIDQFEELATMTHTRDERQAILNLIAELLRDHSEKLDIVITLRSDFEPQFSRGPLEEFWVDGRYIVQPMTQDELRDCIVNPASTRVLYFKPDELVDDLINEVVSTPGGLPLLSFALSEMYIHYVGRGSDDRAIERIDYEAVGGVVGALRSRADAEYEKLDTPHRETMRQIMLRMVSAGGGGNVARRRVMRSELEFEDPQQNERVRSLVNTFVEARLVVTGKETSADDGPEGEDYVEPAHDALVRAWDRLLHWVHEENRDDLDDLRFQRKLATDAEAWDNELDKALRRGVLWNDAARSAGLHALLKRGVTWMNRRERQFAENSVKARRRIIQSLALGAIVVVLLAAGAVWQWIAAVAERDRAIARGLATHVETNLGNGNLYAAVQIASKAVDQFPDVPATNDALMSIATHRTAQLASFQMPWPASAHFNADEQWIVAEFGDAGARDLVAIHWEGQRRPLTEKLVNFNMSAGRTWALGTRYTPPYINMNADGESMCGPYGPTTAYDLTQLHVDRIVEIEVSPFKPEFSPDDGVYVTACGQEIYLTEMSRSDADDLDTSVTSMFDTGYEIDDAWHVGENRIFASLADATHIYADDGELLLELEGHFVTEANGTIVTAFVDDDDQVLGLDVWDEHGELLFEADGYTAVLSTDGRRVAYQIDDGTVGVQDLRPEGDVNVEVHELPNGLLSEVVLDVADYEIDGTMPRFSADGSLIMTTIIDDDETVVWDARTGDSLFWVDGVKGVFAESIPVILTVTDETNIRLWDMRRVPAEDPLIWNGLQAELNVPGYIQLDRDGDQRCDDAAECTSPDGSVTVSSMMSSVGVGTERAGYFVSRNVDGEPQWPDETGNDTPEPGLECTSLNGISFSNHDDTILLACDAGIELLDKEGRLLQTWDEGGRGRGAEFSYDGRYILSFRSDNTARAYVYGAPQGTSSYDLGPHDSLVVAADIHANGLIAIGSASGTIQLWDQTGQRVRRMFADDSEIDKVAFSADGTVLFARTEDDMIYQWALTPDDVLDAFGWVKEIDPATWRDLIE